MRLAHLADLHLGFRQFDRSAPSGLNQREKDVQDALERTVADLIAQRPDLVLIAGDVFHHVRPSNTAIVFLSRQLDRLHEALPDAPIIIVAGNHETPRSMETGAILPLYHRAGVQVVTGGLERLTLPGCTVTCVPSSAARQLADVVPDPNAPVNVLLIHAAAPLVSHGEADVTDEQLQAWEYVALGDYHVVGQVGPRAWYSGALEFTSTDPWAEVRTRPEKGWLLVEVTPGAEPTVQFRPVATRRFLDLPRIDAQHLTAEQLDAALAGVLGAVDLTDTVARLVVENCPRDLERAIDRKAVRAFKAGAFHLQVDYRRPEAQAHVWAANVRQARTLSGITDQFLEVRALPADVDRDALRKLAQEYMAAASAAADPYTGEKVA